MRVVAIIQARMSSTRLPGKVLLDLAGEPMLARVVDRTRRAQTRDEVVIATTVQASTSLSPNLHSYPQNGITKSQNVTLVNSLEDKTQVNYPLDNPSEFP